VGIGWLGFWKEFLEFRVGLLFFVLFCFCLHICLISTKRLSFYSPLYLSSRLRLGERLYFLVRVCNDYPLQMAISITCTFGHGHAEQYRKAVDTLPVHRRYQ